MMYKIIKKVVPQYLLELLSANISSRSDYDFTGLGKLNDVKIKLNIDQDKTPKVQPNRRTLFHIRNKVKNALEELEQEDVIERVPDKQPTPWVSPVVAVPKKDGGVRIDRFRLRTRTSKTT